MKHAFAPTYTWRSAILASDLPTTTRHILLTLSCYMSEAGLSAFPSTIRLGADTGLSRETVSRHLSRARKLGWITVEQRQRSNGGTSSNLYGAIIPQDHRPRDGGSQGGVTPGSQAKGLTSPEGTIQENKPQTEAGEDAGAKVVETLHMVKALHVHFNKCRKGRDLKLTGDRVAKYRARLRTYTFEDLLVAISNALRDPFYTGSNNRGTRYDYPETILKNDAAVDRHLEGPGARSPPREPYRAQGTPEGDFGPDEATRKRLAAIVVGSAPWPESRY